MNRRKSASKNSTGYYRVIIEDIVLRIVDVQADSQEDAIQQAKEFPAWTCPAIDRMSKISGARKMTGGAEVDYLDDPIFHSSYRHEEC